MKNSWLRTFEILRNINRIIAEAQFSRVATIFIYSSIIVIYCNFLPMLSFVRDNFRDYNIVFAFFYSISGILISIALTSLCLGVFAFFSKKVLKIVAIIYAIVGSVYCYVSWILNVKISPEIINDVLGANTNDVVGILSVGVIFIIGFLGILPACLIWRINIKPLSKGKILKTIRKFLIGLTVLLLISYLLCYKSYKKSYWDNIKKSSLPVAILMPTEELIMSYQHISCVVFNYCTEREKLRTYKTEEFDYKSATQEPIIAIFVIGESLRSDRLSANGYERKTTPWLDDAVKSYNTFVFKDVLSCEINTEMSVPCMMSNVKIGDFHDANRTTTKAFSSLLTKMGFETYFYALQYSLITNRWMIDFFDTKHSFTRDDLRKIDGQKGYYLDKYVIDHLDNNVQVNTAYIIHTQGSHKPYYTKYLQEHKQFDNNTISDQYDNSIIAFDEFMKLLVDKFKNKNAFIFYVSDHGESFGEINPKTGKPAWFHGVGAREDAPKEQRLVPIIIWASNKYILSHQSKFNNLTRLKNKKTKLDITHDNVWHTFLDCIGIESKNIDKNMSLCSHFNKNYVSSNNIQDISNSLSVLNDL